MASVTNTTPTVYPSRREPNSDAPQDTDGINDEVVQELLASGLTLDMILLPGFSKHDILFIPDDFNEPLAAFED